MNYPAGSATATQVCLHAVERLRDNDFDGWVDLCDEQVLVEFPFAPEGMPGRVTGKDAVSGYVHRYLGDLQFEDVPELTIYETDTPGTIVMEMCATGRIKTTGAPYDMRYIAVATVHDGHFVRYREYWDPLRVQQALSGGSE